MTYSTYRARKPLRIGEEVRQPGELVPEAQQWFRVDHLVHAGFLIRQVVSDDDFEQAVKTYCPGLTEALVRPEGEDMRDEAAIRAQKLDRLMSESPREALARRHEAPVGNPTDPSNSDVDAKAALDAAALTEAWEKRDAERAKKELEDREKAAGEQDRGVEAGKQADLDGAHKEFVSERLDLSEEDKKAREKQAKAPQTLSREASEQAAKEGDQGEGEANQKKAEQRLEARETSEKSATAKLKAAATSTKKN